MGWNVHHSVVKINYKNSATHTVTFPHLPGQDSVAMVKAYIDLRWNMTFAEYQAMPDWTPIPDEGIAQQTLIKA